MASEYSWILDTPPINFSLVKLHQVWGQGPQCECGSPTVWHKDSRRKDGGYWRCLDSKRRNDRRYWNPKGRYRRMKRRIEQRIVLKQVKVSMLEQDLSKYVTDFNITIKGV